ncbi:MAG TPA: hypothetical protein VI895_04485 [Bdellovibrionota bacterium]|nr:hypothetical protein [Bdellovibrionota bacterium]
MKTKKVWRLISCLLVSCFFVQPGLAQQPRPDVDPANKPGSCPTEVVQAILGIQDPDVSIALENDRILATIRTVETSPVKPVQIKLSFQGEPKTVWNEIKALRIPGVFIQVKGDEVWAVINEVATVKTVDIVCSDDRFMAYARAVDPSLVAEVLKGAVEKVADLMKEATDPYSNLYLLTLALAERGEEDIRVKSRLTGLSNLERLKVLVLTLTDVGSGVSISPATSLPISGGLLPGLW